MYELAYCDDAVSVIGHSVYTLGPLLFRRHHRHCLSIFTFICWTNCSLPLPTNLNIVLNSIYTYLRHNLIGIVCLLSQRHSFTHCVGKRSSNNVLFLHLLDMEVWSLPVGCIMHRPLLVHPIPHVWCTIGGPLLLT